MTIAHESIRTAAPSNGLENMVWIPWGTFRMGSDRHYPEEAPAHNVKVSGFWSGRHSVTKAEFRRFVDETGYVTVAERPANPEDYSGAKPELLVPSSVVFRKTDRPVDLRNPYNWWAYVAGADWRHPRGPDSSIDGRFDHPVVHVPFEDAEAYAKWLGQELPAEAEREQSCDPRTRTRMSAGRTLMSVIRTSLSLIGFGFTIYQVFEKLLEAQVLRSNGAPRRFGEALVFLGVTMLVLGIGYHIASMLELRRKREQLRTDGLIHAESEFPASLTLIVAFILLAIGVFAVMSMTYQAGPFD